MITKTEVRMTEKLFTEATVGDRIALLGEQAIVNGNLVTPIVTVTREAHDAGIERFVQIEVLDHEGFTRKMIGWRDNATITVITERELRY